MNRKITLLALLIFNCAVSFSQFRSYETDSGWNIGFNSGGTWQEKEAIVSGSDTAYTQPFTSIRGGFTFGKSLYEEEGSFFAFDLRFRYLRGINYGWSKYLETIPVATISGSNLNPFLPNEIQAYKNYKMDLNEFSLEGVLTLNRLLENTGIIMYGFGGVGLVDYRVKTDYINGYLEYNYPDLTYLSSRDGAKLLRDYSDLQFESNAPGVLGNQLKFMPSLGFGLGYQFNEVFSIGLEHKLTYALHNDLDGMSSDNLNDRYHYTAINMRFNILEGGGSNNEVNQEMFQEDYYQPTVVSPPPTVINTTTLPPVETAPPVTEVSVKTLPQVNIVLPYNNYTDVNSANYTIKANIAHVTGKQNITFFLNGAKQPDYLFNYVNNIFRADIQLQTGINQVRIIGENQDGTASDQVTLNYILVEEKNPPTVAITSPSNNYVDVNSANYTIKANMTHVPGKQNITFLLNGVKQQNYLFNYVNNIFRADIQLQTGINQVRIIGENQDGTASDQVTLNYILVEEKNPPTVAITTPSGNPYLSEKETCSIVASVKNISNRTQIKFYVNNQINNSFTFSSVTSLFKSNVALNNGENNLLIRVSNTDGTASDNIKILYEKRIIGNPPKVTIVSPSTNPYEIQQSTCTIKSFVYNIDNKQNITVVWNNSQIKNYSFNTLTKQLVFNAILNEGANNITISAQNNFGSDSESTTINYKKPEVIALPKVTIDYPSASLFNTDKEVILVSGKIYNVSSASNASAVFNTKPAKYFDFNPGSKAFQSELTLVPGSNTFTVNANNASGSDSEYVTIVYTPTECDNPAINRVLPQNSAVSTTNNKAYIEMQVLHTQNIDFKINGNSSSGYNFNVNTGVFSTMLNLTPGTTVYTLLATNDCGSVSQTVTYQLGQPHPQGQAPDIQMNVSNTSSSYANPIIINASSAQITGKISNHDSNTMMSYSSSPINKAKLDYTLSNGNISGVVFLPPSQVIKVTITAQNKWGTNSTEIYFKKVEKAPQPSGSSNSKSKSTIKATKPIKNTVPTPSPTINVTDKNNDYYQVSPTITNDDLNDNSNDSSDDDSDNDSFDDTYEEPFSWPEAPKQKEEWSPPPAPAPAPTIKEPVIAKPQKKQNQKTTLPAKKAPVKAVKPNPIKPKVNTSKSGGR
jgi:hypothetical protein